jgi:hypothetical protein
MGKKLTEQEIKDMIKKDPNNQRFDECHVCNGIEDFMEMEAVDDIDSFDLICNECKPKQNQ